MKKFLLSAFAACCMCAAPAQENPMPYQSHAAVFTKVSTNGKWAVGSTMGVGYFLNAQTGNLTVLNDSKITYDIYSVSNTGVAVGSYTFDYGARTPFYLTEEGGIVELPFEGSGVGMDCSDDGSIIVGNTDRPVVWYRNASGGYDEYQELDFEVMGFDKRPNQSSWAMGVSNDGLKIYGRIKDGSGSLSWPVIWERSSASSRDWTYRKLCKDYCFNKDEICPEWPQYKPEKPDPTGYFDEEELAAFNHALELYNDSVAKYDWTLPAEEREPYPTYNPEEHVTDFFDVTTTDGVERHNRYVNDYNQFKDDAIAYNDSIALYIERFDKYVIEENKLNVLNIAFSNNGKYLSTLTPYKTVLIDTQTENVIQIEGTDNCYPTAMLDDGTVFIGQRAAIPPLDRIPSVYKDGALITFDEWLKGRSQKAYEDLIADFPDGHFGVVFSRDSEGATFGGFNEALGYGYKGWVMDLNAYDDFTAGISDAEIAGDDISVSYNRDAGRINITGADNADVRIFAVNGSCVCNASGVSGSLSVPSLVNGAYIVEVKAEGKVIRKKVILQ